MNSDPTSLDRLHDVVSPKEVGWWPMAPGWCFLGGIAFLLILYFVHRAWRNWQANAYRRVALRELYSLEDATAIAELLRRTALAIAPRSEVAGKTGPDWTAWLSAQCPCAMSESVQGQLTNGVYGRPGATQRTSELRDYAARWITSHRRSIC